MKDIINANDNFDQAAQDSYLSKLVDDFGSGAEAEESLFSFRNILGLGLFSKVFGIIKREHTEVNKRSW